MIAYCENRLTAGEMNQIRRAVAWTPLPEEQLQAALARSACTVAAYRQGQPVGMARLVGDGVYCLLCDVAVVPSAQGQGVGSALVRRALARAESALREGQRCTVVLVSARGKEPFYRAFGFSSLPGGHAGDGMQLLLTR